MQKIQNKMKTEKTISFPLFFFVHSPTEYAGLCFTSAQLALFLPFMSYLKCISHWTQYVCFILSYLHSILNCNMTHTYYPPVPQKVMNLYMKAQSQQYSFNFVRTQCSQRHEPTNVNHVNYIEFYLQQIP